MITRIPAGRRAFLIESAVAALAAVLVAGCSASPQGGGEATSASPTIVATATTGSSTASPAENAEDAAIDAYLGMWAAMAEAAKTSDVKDHSRDPAAIARYATGDALTAILRSLHTDYLNGVVTKGRPRNNPEVASMKPSRAPTTVLIEDCGDSSQWLKYKDGRLVDDEPGGRRSITAEVKRQDDGSWRVTRFAVMGLGSC